MDPHHRNLASKQASGRINETEFYFLISKFLSAGPCIRAAQAIREEIEENQLLPLAYSWTGEKRRLTLSQYEKNYPHITNNHLIQICSRIGPILDSNIPPSVPGINTLLGAGSTSLLRTSSVIKSGNPSHALYRRHHEAPLLPSSNKAASNPGNIVNILSSRESSGPLSVGRTLSTFMYSKQQRHKRYLGHLSAVYCVAFDRTGKYIFTGADDSLVKIWSAISGRLLATLRGHSAEITDLAVNFENTLLASGSCDKIIRVWSLRTTEPITILVGHTATITSLKFCPYSVTENRFLMSTSNDGSVNIWRWNASTNLFDSKPTKFMEKSRNAKAQILCSSFSPGGSFLAVGSTDHFVRIYRLSPPSGPIKILEIEVNSDQVDSIQFSNFGLKLISGSKDGTAHIWWFERQTWQRRLLDMSEVLQTRQPVAENDGKQNKIKVNMVCWTCDDAYVITAVSDRSIKVWEANTGKLKHVLLEHEDEVFVLEANPADGRIFLSGGHDGKIIIWDVNLGSSLAVFYNRIDDQTVGAIFDCKFSPDGQIIASTDSQGHLAIYGYGTSDRYERVPNDVFFHTDYRPLIRDANHYVIDEQTQCAPHLMPPPFLVDVDGNPYPPHLQRLVPGRENCKEDQLVPYIAIQNERGVAEVLQPVVGGQEVLPQALNRQPQQPFNPQEPVQQPFFQRINRLRPPPPPPPTPPPPPPPPPAPIPAPSSLLQSQLQPQLQPQLQLQPQPQPQPQLPSHFQSRPTIDDMIERLAQEQARERVNVEHGYAAPSSVSGDEQGAQRGRSLSQSLQGPSLLRNGPRVGQGEGQGVRQPGASWQSRDKMSTTPLGGRVVVETLRHGILTRMLNLFRLAAETERVIYETESSRRRFQEIPRQETPKTKESTKAKQKKRVVRRNQDSNIRTIADNAESSALSRNQGGSSVSNDLENVEDLVSMDESDSNYSDSDIDSWSGSSTGESDSEGEEDEEDEDDDEEESGDDEQRSEIVTRSARTRSRRKKRRPDSWQQACLQLIEEIWQQEDSEPFRIPVDDVLYPDYRTYVDTPMDLSTIKEELMSGNYRSVHDFSKDMETMFENSRKYNTDKRSQIYHMTVRLRKWFMNAMYKIGSRGNRQARRAAKKKDSRYTLRNKRQRKENQKYEDYVTTMHPRKKKTKLKRKNGERPKGDKSRAITTTASSCSSRSTGSPENSFDPSQPSTSGLSSRITSHDDERKTKRTRRRVIRSSSGDDENDRSVADDPTSNVNGLTNGVKTKEYLKSLVQSEDEDTDIETSTKANGFNHHSDSDTEIESRNDTDATEIAGDDETQDAVDNNPCEGKLSLPRKRRKVRKNSNANRKRLKTVNGTGNGGTVNGLNKIPMKRVSTTKIKTEPGVDNDPAPQQGKTSTSDEDICGTCNQNAPPSTPANSEDQVDWIQCETCLKWFHHLCCTFLPNFNIVRDMFACDSCRAGQRPERRRKSQR